MSRSNVIGDSKSNSQPGQVVTETQVEFATMVFKSNIQVEKKDAQANKNEKTMEEFRVLETDEAWDTFVKSMRELGMTFTEVTAMLQKRNKAFNTTKTKHQRALNKQSTARGKPSGTK